MEQIQEKLKQAGLTGNESKVYLELLKKGELSANELSKKISMDRTLTYTVLNNLIEKGMVSYVLKQNKKFFNASTPDNLLNQIRKKEIIINNLLPELKNIQQIKDTPYEINIYEGKEGLRSFFRLISKYQKFYSFGGTGKAYDILYEAPAIAKELEKKQHNGKLIIPPKYKEHEMTKIKSLQIKYLDIKSEATTSIFGDYISIHLLTQKPLIILIKNKEIAQSYQNYFQVLWEIAQK